jgi:hypothetical protein
MHNRLDTDLIRRTHIVLPTMVGTDRPTVTLTLAFLEQDGAIEGGHASIAITNRKNWRNRRALAIPFPRDLIPNLN